MERLRETTGIKIFSENAKGSRNWAYFPILIKDKRDEVYERLKQNRIFSRKYFYPVTSDQACFKNRYRNIEIPVARELASEVLTLPLYEGLSLDDVDRIADIIRTV
ncbi:MAG: DegT/DnrJ/EryC1/StrS family aminotransferase [Selenomonadaceae bacterium]|nr:DegT/DnrJ/EryC1/StrS family aminotransferase [Selenomonadaceae bacterium]